MIICFPYVPKDQLKLSLIYCYIKNLYKFKPIIKQDWVCFGMNMKQCFHPKQAEHIEFCVRIVWTVIMKQSQPEFLGENKCSACIVHSVRSHR